jgi:hypothetical protein
LPLSYHLNNFNHTVENADGIVPFLSCAHSRGEEEEERAIVRNENVFLQANDEVPQQ